MADRRQKNINWYVTREDGSLPGVDQAILAVLMDLRDELQALNRLLQCGSVREIPYSLRDISSHTLVVAEALSARRRTKRTRKPRPRKEG